MPKDPRGKCVAIVDDSGEICGDDAATPRGKYCPSHLWIATANKSRATTEWNLEHWAAVVAGRLADTSHGGAAGERRATNIAASNRRLKRRALPGLSDSAAARILGYRTVGQVRRLVGLGALKVRRDGCVSARSVLALRRARLARGEVKLRRCRVCGIPETSRWATQNHLRLTCPSCLP